MQEWIFVEGSHWPVEVFSNFLSHPTLRGSILVDTAVDIPIGAAVPIEVIAGQSDVGVTGLSFVPGKT